MVLLSREGKDLTQAIQKWREVDAEKQTNTLINSRLLISGLTIQFIWFYSSKSTFLLVFDPRHPQAID